MKHHTDRFSSPQDLDQFTHDLYEAMYQRKLPVTPSCAQSVVAQLCGHETYKDLKADLERRIAEPEADGKHGSDVDSFQEAFDIKVCKKCTEILDVDGYCNDRKCEFFFWPQELEVSQIRAAVARHPSYAYTEFGKRVEQRVVAYAVLKEDDGAEVHFDAAPLFSALLGRDHRLPRTIAEIMDHRGCFSADLNWVAEAFLENALGLDLYAKNLSHAGILKLIEKCWFAHKPNDALPGYKVQVNTMSLASWVSTKCPMYLPTTAGLPLVTQAYQIRDYDFDYRHLGEWQVTDLEGIRRICYRANLDFELLEDGEVDVPDHEVLVIEGPEALRDMIWKA